MDELAVRTLLNSLDASRSSLHVLLHIFTCSVVVGLVFDLFVIIKEFREDWGEFRYGQIHPDENHLPKRPKISLLIFALLGTALIVIGVAGELYVDVQAGKIETQIREANDKLLGLIIQEAGDAAKSARTAHAEANAVKGIADEARADAKDALKKAQTAQRELAHAETDAAKAQTAASRALSTADKAESHIAEALQRAAKAEAELKLLRAPRSLAHRDELIAALRPFSGTEYTLNVFMDDESNQFIKTVAGALDSAGWVRKQPAGMNLGIPTMRIDFGQGDMQNVPACIDTGISLHAYAKESFAVLQSLPNQSLPKTVQAAIAMRSAIALSIFPPDERNVASGVLDPKPAEGIPITICVGKKP